MLPKDLKRLSLLSAQEVFDSPDTVPAKSGIYLFFLRGGLTMLRATQYFEFDDRMPLIIDGLQHLYTGAADNLRDRLEQHMRRDYRSSSLRKTLLSIESGCGAVSKTETAFCRIRSEPSLSKWLCRNALIGIEITNSPFDRERTVIERYASPFNITFRRAHPYSKTLMAWRSAAFPAWRRSARLPTKSEPRCI